MSKGELLQEGTYQFFNLITTLQIGTIAPTLAGASASEVVMLSKVIKNFNLIFKKETALAKQLLSEHKFLEKFERALTPITTTFVNGVEVLAISLGCGKESAKRVIEILKKNIGLIKPESRGGWLEKSIPLGAVYEELIGIAPEIMPNQNLRHLFLGEFNKRGKLVGFHHARSYPGRIKEIIKPCNEHGIYFAKYIYKGKEKLSSFFPDHWDRLTVLKKVSEAYKNPVKFKDYSITGITKEGIKIKMYFLKNKTTNKLIINSAYPIMGGMG